MSAGIARGAKNGAEQTAINKCSDPGQTNRIFGAVWINNISGSDGTDNRWSESVSAPNGATSIDVTMWTTAYNCPGSGINSTDAQIINLAPAPGGNVAIEFPFANAIYRGSSTAGQFTDPPGQITVRLHVGSIGSGDYTVSYTGKFRDNRGEGATNTYQTIIHLTRQAPPTPPAQSTIAGYKTLVGMNPAATTVPSPPGNATVHYECCSPGVTAHNSSSADTPANPYFYNNLPPGDHEIWVYDDPNDNYDFVGGDWNARGIARNPACRNDGTCAPNWYEMVVNTSSQGAHVWWYFRQKDRPPTIAITPDCTNRRALVEISDPDMALFSSGTNFNLNYGIGANGPFAAVTNGYVNTTTRRYQYINLSADEYQYFSQTLSANTAGIRPDGTSTGSLVSAIVSYGGSRGCQPRTFTADPRVATPGLNDDENPSQATLRGYIDMTITPFPSSGSNINFYSGTLTYYVLRGSATTPTAGDVRTIAMSPTSIWVNTTGPVIDQIVAVSTFGTLNPGDRICARFAVDPTRGQVYSNGDIASTTQGRIETPQQCSLIASKPYLKVYGADVMAGGDFAPGCAANDADIRFSFSGGTGISSTTYAAIATGDISGFVSAALKPTSGPGITIIPLATQFTFGNLGHYPISAGQSCVPNFFGQKGTTGAVAVADGAALATKLNGSQERAGAFDSYEIATNATLAGANLPLGRRAIVFVNGTLTINGNLTFTNANSRSAAGQIQSLFIVARHIDIAPGVSTLDGVYIAQPGDGGDGIINTCGVGPFTLTNCQFKLTVNGAFIAKSVKFWRTVGSLRNAGGSFTEPSTSNSAAEQFIFSPDFYLTGSPFNGGTTRYDTFADLPPNF